MCRMGNVKLVYTEYCMCPDNILKNGMVVSVNTAMIGSSISQECSTGID